jgi:hypothetical protein
MFNEIYNIVIELIMSCKTNDDRYSQKKSINDINIFIDRILEGRSGWGGKSSYLTDILICIKCLEIFEEALLFVENDISINYKTEIKNLLERIWVAEITVKAMLDEIKTAKSFDW